MLNEIAEQLRHVIDALAADLYHPLGEIPLEGFRTDRELSLAEAEKLPRQPYPENTVWGQPLDYAWMFGRFTVPESARGERIVMDLKPGGEATLFVNGRPFGARRADRLDHPHHYICDQTVANKARGGEEIAVAMEVYGGTPDRKSVV